jgi:hypothetical protein
MHSRFLLDDWVGELLELCITDEVLSESNDTDDPDLRRALVTTARGYRNLSQHGAPWERHLGRVADLVPRAGVADHRHLARAIEGGATYFVTRDSKVLEGASSLQGEYGIDVLSPESLLYALDRDRREDRYEPATLQGTDYTERQMGADEQDEFVAALLNTGEGERAHVLRGKVRSALANRRAAEVRVVRDPNGTVVAGALRIRHDDYLEVGALRVGRIGRLTDTVARQIAFQQRREAANRRLARVVVTDVCPQPAVLRALDAESFEVDAGLRVCRVTTGIVPADQALGHERTIQGAAAFERRCWPAKLCDGGLTTWMVAIKPAYAEQLLDANLAAASLFPREPELGLSREHVYYWAPGNTTKLVGPARVLWYVAQSPPGYPVGQVRAVSHLVEVITDRPRSLHRRFSRLGVWSQEQVEAAGRRTGSAMALRLTDTQLFADPIDLRDLREMYRSDGRRFAAPRAPVRVSERMFRLIYQRASAYA